MSRSSIITTQAGREALPLLTYNYPHESGSFTGTLVYRTWDRRYPCLLCYFNTDDGKRIVLKVWQKSGSDAEYSPRYSTINFADEVTEGTVWHCEYKTSKKGFSTWETAAEMQ